MSIEAIRNSGLAGLAGGLRRILFDSFKDTSNLKRGEQGRFLPTAEGLQFTPKVLNSKPESNHAVLKRNLGNRFVAKVKVEGKFSPAKASNVGFILKKQDEKNKLAINMQSDGQVRLIKFEDGKKSILKSVKLSEPPTDEFEMAVKVDNRRISFMVDGKEVFEATDDSFKGGEFGFGSFKGTNRFRDLEVYR